MFQGTSSNAGKSVLTAALCRILLQDGLRVAPFKAQNMSLNSFVTRDGGEMGRAQVVQAQACRLEPDVRMNPILLKPNSDTGCQVIVRASRWATCGSASTSRYKPQAFAAGQACYDSLAAEFDVDRPGRGRQPGGGEPQDATTSSTCGWPRYAGAPVLWSATSTAAACSPRSSARWRCSTVGAAHWSPASSSTVSAATRACWADAWTYTLSTHRPAGARRGAVPAGPWPAARKTRSTFKSRRSTTARRRRREAWRSP